MSPLIVLLCLLSLCQSARILGVFPVPSISHQLVFQSIWKELSLRGHQVTVFTPDPLNNASLTNLTEIDMAPTYEVLRKDYIGDGMAKENYVVDQHVWVWDRLEQITVQHFEKGRSLLNDPKTSFDLIIVETLHPLVYSLQCRFKVPIIGVASLSLMLHTHDAVGNPTHPVATPDVFANIMGKMTIYNKICGVLSNVWYRSVYRWSILPRNDAIAKKIWGDHCPYLGDLEKNVSLILVNTNPVIHFPRPLVPNVIEMGQMHISTIKELPKDLQQYLDSSINGVVYVSLGTNVRTSLLSREAQRAFIGALSELPYDVLWKWENNSMISMPRNILVRKWFPQQDILRHKNLKTFVTQGGLQSTEEAISNGVPIVGVPFIADQALNVMKITTLGLGRVIEHRTVTKEELKEAILDVAENPKYREKVQVFRNLFSDQPMSGLNKSIWWIEYVLRNKGARHLRSEAADLTFIEYYMLDVFFVLASGFIAFIFGISTIFNLLSKLCTKKTKRD